MFRLYGHPPLCPDFTDTLLCVQTLWTPSFVSRRYGHPPMCPDFTDTLLCVQTLWTPSYVSRLYGHPPMCPDFTDTLLCAQTLRTRCIASSVPTVRGCLCVLALPTFLPSLPLPYQPFLSHCSAHLYNSTFC